MNVESASNASNSPTTSSHSGMCTPARNRQASMANDHCVAHMRMPAGMANMTLLRDESIATRRDRERISADDARPVEAMRT